MRISRHRHKRPTAPPKIRVRFNEFIRVPEVRVIDNAGEHIGLMTRDAALALAREQDKDLVEINPGVNPPVCKIMDFGQFKYQQEKLEKIRKAKSKEILLKGVRLSPRIGQHDIDMRRDQALEFLKKGHNVKIEIILRGRERGHVEIAYRVIREFIASIQIVQPIRTEQPVTQQGPRVTATIAPAGEKKPDATPGDSELDEE